jgi:hypothetical protein
MPSPQARVTDTTASNVSQLSDQQSIVGENSPLHNGLHVLPIPYIQHLKSGPSTPLHPTTPLIPITTTQTSTYSSPPPDNPQFGMHVSLWPLSTQAAQSTTATTQTQSLTFQHQVTPTLPLQPTIPLHNTYATYSPSYPTTAYPWNLQSNVFTSYSPPMHYYTSQPNPYLHQTHSHAPNYWSRPPCPWPNQTTTPHNFNQFQHISPNPPNHNQENTFAQSFSRSLKIDFPNLMVKTQWGGSGN